MLNTDRFWMFAVLLLVSSFSVVYVAGCGGSGTGTTQQLVGPAAISDESTGGTEGFFFLPPLAPEPQSADPFDPSLTSNLKVEVFLLDENNEPTGDPVAVFTDTSESNASETIRCCTTDEHYIVNFHTNTYDLVDGATCRIFVRRKSDNAEYGYADAQVFANMKHAKSLVDDTTFALKDGRTLPVKFRIEEGAEPTLGKILVYTMNEDDAYGDTAAVLRSAGYQVTQECRGSSRYITSSLLAGYDQIWFITYDDGHNWFLSESELDAIESAWNSGAGLFIAADDHDYHYQDHANDICEHLNLGLNFSGKISRPNTVYVSSPDFDISHPIWNGVSSISAGTQGEGKINVSDSDVSVIGKQGGTNMFAVGSYGGGRGRVVFDAGYYRLIAFAAGDEQYLRNVAAWLE